MTKHGSLFSGIGGFDIAATWMGWQNVFSCEKNPFCRSVLKYYWPNTHHYEDIFQLNAARYRDGIDIITGGFPCQPFSQSGRRKGKTDDRYLFPEACRIIRQAKPKWIVLENVAGLFSILEPDSISEMEIKAVELFCKDNKHPANRTIIKLQRRVIASIIAEIRAAGYVFPTLKDGTPVILCIPASGIGAPHHRDRVWFVAHADSLGDQQQGDLNRPGSRRKDITGQKEQKGQRWTGFANGLSDLLYTAGTIETWSSENERIAQFCPGQVAEGATAGTDQGRAWETKIPAWQDWPAQSPFCSGDDGLPPLLDGITFPAWRDQSVMAYGNAIVPQVALEIFCAIQRTMRSDAV